MILSLTRAPEFLALETPKDFLGQLTVASEQMRRAQLRPPGDDVGTELERFREIFEG